MWLRLLLTATMQLPGVNPEEVEARILIEKKTSINLIEGFAVAVKHYLRGEEGIDYADLYHLVKYLPSYPLPTGIPSQDDFHMVSNSPTRDQSGPHMRKGQHRDAAQSENHHRKSSSAGRRGSILDDTLPDGGCLPGVSDLPLPATSPSPRHSLDKPRQPRPMEKATSRESASDTAVGESKTSSHLDVPPRSLAGARLRKSIDDLKALKPAYFSPGFGWSDFLPSFLTRRYDAKPDGGHHGRRGAKLHAKFTLTHNIPLEISLYLSSYVAALQGRQGAVDGPTICAFQHRPRGKAVTHKTQLAALLASIQQLTDALTGLERVQTTPVPFSYSFHIWIVTMVYCFFLPFQLWPPLGWITIPGTTIAAFVFFGFLVAGEEIEVSTRSLFAFTSAIAHDRHVLEPLRI